MNVRFAPLALMILLLAAPAAQARVIHVPADQPSIQEGINAASDGDTVLVADGVYTGFYNRNIRYFGKAVTLRSANGPANCIIDCEHSDRAVTFEIGSGPGMVFEGFTIRNGREVEGGGIGCWAGSQPRITGNLITDCTALYQGGGIFCESNSYPQIYGNRIIGNSATDSGGGIRCGTGRVIGNTISGNIVESTGDVFGGGLACVSKYNEIRDNVIIGNQLNGGRCFGGGIYVDEEASSYIFENQIYFNLLNGAQGYGAGIHAAWQSWTHIAGNRINLNQSTVDGHRGGGIYLASDAVTLILSNRLVDNASSYQGGGIWIGGGTVAIIAGNEIRGNFAGAVGGGGLFLYNAGPGTDVSNNLIASNSVDFPGSGGGIRCQACSPPITNNTIINNTAGVYGGGLYSSGTATIEVTNCILWGNQAPQGPQIGLTDPSALDVSYSDVQGGAGDVYVAVGASLLWGVGNIVTNPLFVSGPLGDHYLSQTAAGQGADSPCVDSGEPGSAVLWATTRTDSLIDGGAVDMGYHVPMVALVAGPGRGYDNPPRVRVFPPAQGAAAIHDFTPYGSPHYGVNVATGDMDGDGLDEILTGAGPGAIYGPHVRGFEMDGTPLNNINFLAYGTNKYGVNVAAGDLSANGRCEVVTGAGPGAVFGPHVRAFRVYMDETVPIPEVSFFAYGTLKWGVNVACGDIDGDGIDEIVTGPGPGAVFGPHVRGWNFDDSSSIAAIPGVSFLSYGTNKYGVNVSCGDVDGDGIDEIVTAPGPGSVFGAHVRGWDYDGEEVVQLPGFSFFAWDASVVRYGARVAVANIDDDLQDELIVGAGPDPVFGSPVKVYVYHNPNVTQLFTLDAFPAGYHHGTTVAGGRF